MPNMEDTNKVAIQAGLLSKFLEDKFKKPFFALAENKTIAETDIFCNRQNKN